MISTVLGVIFSMSKSLLVEGVIRQVVLITLKTAINSAKVASKSSTNKIDDELVSYLDQVFQVFNERWEKK